MKTTYAEQFGTCCLVVEPGDTADDALEYAYEVGAYYDDGEDECLVVEFPGRPQELYTRSAFMRSFSGDSE